MGGGVAAVIVLLAIVGGLLFMWASRGPVSVDMLRPAITDALQRRVGSGYAFELGAVSIEKGEQGLAVTLDGLKVKGPTGQTVVLAPRAEVSLDPVALMYMSVQPTSLEVYDVDVRLSVLENGAISVSAGTDPIVVQPPPPRSSAASADTPAAALEPSASPSTVAAAGRSLRAMLDLVTSADSPLAALQKVGVARGKLVFEDQRTQQHTTFEGLSLAFDKRPGDVLLEASAKGPNGRWRVTATTSGVAGTARTFDLEVADLSLDEVALAGQMRDLPVDFDMPISARFSVHLDPAGRATDASGRFVLGAGFLTTSDPDFEPLRVDEASGAFAYDPAAHRFNLRDMQFYSGGTHIVASGVVTPAPTPGAPWSYEFQTTPDSVFGPERPGEAPLAMTASHFNGHIVPATQTMVIDRFDLAGPELKFAMTGEIGWGDNVHLALRADAGRMPGKTVLRLWPSAIGPPVHAWLFEHMTAGTLERGNIAVDLTADDLAAIKRHLGPVDSHSKMEFAVSGASLNFLAGVPPLAGLDMSGRVTGRTVNVVATKGVLDAGNGRKLTLLDGTFDIADTDPKPTAAQLNIHLGGTIDSLADVLNRDALKAYASLPIDTNTVHGQTDGHLAIDMRLSNKMKPDDILVRANATVTNFSAEKLVGKEKLDAATLNVSYDRGALKATGQGKLFGAPATVELARQTGGVTYATISMSLDDAARAKQGFSFGSALTGPVGAKMVSALGQSDKVEADVELDFTKAAIDRLFPGVVKPAGRPGKATFALTMAPEGATLDNLAFDAGTTTARGALALDAGGNLSQARFSQVRLSPGDDMKIDAEQTREGLKVSMRGSSIDARPFLKALFSGESGNGRDATGNKDIDLEIKAPLVTGNNRQAIANLDMRMTRKGGSVRQFQFSGRLGREPVSGTMNRGTNSQPPTLSVVTNSGGDLLAFLDLYKRMEGGRLTLSMVLGDNGVGGQLAIRDFVLRDEPALRRLVAEGVQTNETRGANGQVTRIDTTTAHFTKVQLDFQRVDGRIDLRNASMFGTQIGLTLEGSVDFPHDKVNLSGTFVPAYGVNNLFSQIPVVGLILGGGQHEGLFGVNFRIGGAASAPVLSINPLSAIAPGFLRKIFGVVENGGSTTSEPPPLMTTPQAGGAPAPMSIGPR